MIKLRALYVMVFTKRTDVFMLGQYLYYLYSMKRLLLLGYLVTFIACSKDNKPAPPIIEEGIYRGDRRVYGNSTTLFTGNGSIHDTAVINTYIRRKWTTSPFYAETDHDSMCYRQTLNVIGNSVFETNDRNSLRRQYNVVRKTENTFWIVMVYFDSTTVFPKNPETLSCNNIAMKIRQIPIVNDCMALPGGASKCNTKTRWPFTKTTDYISRPLFSYTFERTTAGSTCGFSEFDIPDFYNSIVTDQLQPGDTLLVQAGTYFLYKK